MARFIQKPGTVGKWDQDLTALTITLGEIAEVILEGGGPPGKELLQLSAVTTTTAAFEELMPSGNRRFFRITPLAAGEVRIAAKIPGTNVDHAQPLAIIALPRKPSSIGIEHIIIFSPCPGTDEGDRIDFVRRRAVNSIPEKQVVRVDSFAEFVNFLRGFRDAGRRIGSMEFFTHGSPGVVGLGENSFHVLHIRSMASQGFNTVFVPGAQITFGGCNIAQDTKGVNFLKEFGQVFLFNGGGSVAASTSPGHGLAAGFFWTGKQVHFTGVMRKLFFDTTGRVIGWEGLEDFDLSSVGLHPAPALAR